LFEVFRLFLFCWWLFFHRTLHETLKSSRGLDQGEAGLGVLDLAQMRRTLRHDHFEGRPHARFAEMSSFGAAIAGFRPRYVSAAWARPIRGGLRLRQFEILETTHGSRLGLSWCGDFASVRPKEVTIVPAQKTERLFLNAQNRKSGAAGRR